MTVLLLALLLVPQQAPSPDGKPPETAPLTSQSTAAPAPETPPPADAAPAERTVVDTDGDEDNEPAASGATDGSRRVLDAPAPADADAEPASDREVVGRREVTPRAAPKPKKAKPPAAVQRDKDGNVVVPARPLDMTDPLRPEASSVNGPERAFVTGLQVGLAALFGGGLAVGCGVLACGPSILASVALTVPILGALLMGGLLAFWGPLHTAVASVGLFLPVWFQENDVLPLLGGVAVLAAVDIGAWLVGGVLATAILLRWPHGPGAAFVTVRGPIPLPPVFPELGGSDVALLGTAAMVMGFSAFVGPLLAVVAYSAINAVRGLVSRPSGPSAAPAKPDDRAQAPRRKAPRRRHAVAPAEAE